MPKTKFPPYYYDKELKRLSCFSYRDLLLTINRIRTKGKHIDVDSSIFLSPYSVMYEDKEYKTYFAWYEMFPALNEDFGIDLDLTKCYAGSSTFYLVLKEHLEILDEPYVYEEDKLEKIVPTLSESAQDEEISSYEENPSTVQEETEGPDYLHLESFFDKDDVSGSKKRLESEVKRLYGIDLRRNQNFEKMIDQLKEELN